MVRRRSRRKPLFTKKEPSLEQQKHPTRKRGRPRKIVKEEEKADQGRYEEEQQEKKMKLEARLDDAGQTQIVEQEEESAAAAGDVKEEVQAEEAKPKSRGRRKSQPRKST